MTHRLRTVAIVIALLAVSAGYATAQLIVFDALTTWKNSVTAGLKELLIETLSHERDVVKRMAKRLSALTDLTKYALPDPPRWRTHPIDGDQFLYAYPFMAALNTGDTGGTGYARVSRDREPPGAELAALQASAPDAYKAILAALATLDLADSSLIVGTDQAGELRFNGRRELEAIDTFMADAIDPSSEQSATAVLDKISGSALIESRQQQTRAEFLTAITEQLLIDNKRARDTEAAVMNMQLGRLRNGTDANTAFIAGAASDLRSWRQP
jgi:hypothetical protein